MADFTSFFNSTKKSPATLDANTVRRDKLDDGMFDSMVETAEVFRKAVEASPSIEAMDENMPDEVREKFKHYPDLMGDIWKSLFTGQDPGVLGDEEIKPSRLVNRRIAQRVIASDEFQAVKPDCRHAEVEACFTTMSMGEKLQGLLGEEMREMAEKANEAATKERTAELAQEKLEAMREEVREQGGEATPEQEEAIQEAAQRKTNAREGAAKAAEEVEQMPITVGAAEQIEAAAEEGKKGAQVVASLPGVGKGQDTQLSVDEQLRLAQMFKDNPNLFAIAEAVGRIVRDMRFKRARRIVGGNEEVVDVELGNDLPRLFVSELAKLMDEDLELDFYRRFYERGLLEYSKIGSAEAGKGPLVCVMDGSGSMSGQKNVWARALALALLHICRREKRDFHAVEFSHSETEQWSFPFSAGIDPEVVARMAGHFFGGGTDITLGLEVAEGTINSAPKFSKADVVLLSDGIDWFEEDDRRLREFFESEGIRVHGIMLGDRPSEYLHEMCDVEASAYDFSGPNQATDILAAEIT